MALRLHPGAADRAHLAAVAAGREPADAVVTGGTLVDVFTEELLPGWGLAIARGRVAYAGPDAGSRAGAGTRVVDATGALVSPGLFEGHTHVTRISPRALLARHVDLGITTTVLETMELGLVAGPAGVRALMADALGAPGRVLFTVSGTIAIDAEHEQRLAPPEEWLGLLDEPGVAGVGEVYWADFLRGHPRTEALVEAALERGLAVEGHGAGARPAALAALAASGIDADHEGIDAEDELARLRLGLFTYARHGATRQDLPAIAPLWQGGGPDVGRVGFVTDGVEPGDLQSGFALNRVVEEAIASGLPPARAIRMASRNPAERFGVGRWLGGFSPGAFADVAVVEPGGFRPRLVLVAGEPPARAAASRFPEALLDSVRLPGVEAALLAHPGPGRWRAMRYAAPTVTREEVTDGRGALPVLAVDRLGGGAAFRGLALGLDLVGGAVALSTAWESPSLLAAGDSSADLAAAMRRVVAMRGGVAVVRDGEVLASWRAEIGGMYTHAPLSEVVDAVAAVNGALRDLGCSMPNPLLSLETLTTAAIPFLRISSSGYVDIRTGRRLGFEVD